MSVLASPTVEQPRLHESGTLAWTLQRAIEQGAFGLNDVPILLKQVIDEERWQDFIVKVTGEHVHYGRFEEFVRAHPPNGLGTDITTLKRLCQEHPEIVDAIDEATRQKPGAHQGNQYTSGTFDNVQRSTAPTGNSTAAILRRLRDHHPAIHARVLAKEISPHAGGIEAGFLHPTISVRTDDGRSAAQALSRHMNRAELTTLVDELLPLIAEETDS